MTTPATKFPLPLACERHLFCMTFRVRPRTITVVRLDPDGILPVRLKNMSRDTEFGPIY